MNVSVCVVFRNSESTLPELLRSFQYLPTSSHHFEFLFVDNDSTDRSNEIIQSAKLPNCRIFHRNLNHLAEARNQSLQNSTHEYLYFIDSDCSLNENTWSELLKNADFDHFHGWGGSQKFPDTVPFLSVLDEMRTHYLGHFGSAQMKVPKYPTEVDHLSTTHVLYKKEMLLNVGGFDSRLATSAEDLELSLRIQQKNYRLQLIPSSQVNHFICRNLLDWLKKAWRNGVWQTRLVAVNFSILKTRRFWPPAILLFLLLADFDITPYLIIFYLVYLLFLTYKKKQALALYLLFLSTHAVYFISGLYGYCLAFHDFIISKVLPKRTKN